MIPFVGKFEYIDVCCTIFNRVVYGEDRICMIQAAKNTGNARAKRDYRGYYTRDMVRLVENKCRRELDMFGYSFNGTDDRAVIDMRTFKYTNPIIV